jgi:hypothetical protein
MPEELQYHPNKLGKLGAIIDKAKLKIRKSSVLFPKIYDSKFLKTHHERETERRSAASKAYYARASAQVDRLDLYRYRNGLSDDQMHEDNTVNRLRDIYRAIMTKNENTK